MKNLLYTFIFLTIGNINAQSNIKVGEKAPQINITNWIKNVPNSKDLKNKYIVLEFWATWCGPCIAAVPHMNSLQKEFNQKDLYFVSITDESVEKVQRSLKRINFKSIVVTDLTKETQINFGDGVKGLDTYPLTVLIDNNGIIKWIGEPKSLDSKIMTKFLSNSTKESEKEFEKKSDDQVSIYNFDYLLNNKDVKYYFNLRETESDKKTKRAIGNSLIAFESYKLQDIYNDIFNVKNNQLEIPAHFANKNFDLIYKNSEEPKNVSLIENEILKKLNLKKEVAQKTKRANIVYIQDNSLLEETLETRFSGKSDADNKIIFTAFTIEDMLNELTNRSSEIFKFNKDNDIKYDFIIEIKSKQDIIDSLKSYGLRVEQKDVKIEHIKLLSGTK